MINMQFVIFFCLFVTFGIPVILFFIGWNYRERNKDFAKTFYIIAAVWLLIGGGVCATILMQ